jgi:hypothetical protein
MGPVDRSDTSEGLKAYAWRARIDSGVVYLCRRNNANDGWEAEEELFTADASGTAVINEISLTWDQNARPAVAFNEDGVIKLWWWDASIPANDIRAIASGRNPIAYLDDRNPANVSYSDILVFLVQPSTDRMFYVRQRDRYDTAYVLPVDSVAYKFLMLVVMGNDRRLHIYYIDLGLGKSYCELSESDQGIETKVMKSSVYPPFVDEEYLEYGPDDFISMMKRIAVNTATAEIEFLEYGPDDFISMMKRSVMLDETIDPITLEYGPDDFISMMKRIAMLTNTIDSITLEYGPDDLVSIQKYVP